MGRRYLEGAALDAAQEWLESSQIPADEETADEMIACYYPGGLHWFIAQNLVDPYQT